jgi:hypothetical protein
MKKTLLAICISASAIFTANAQQGLTILLDTKKFTNLDCSLGGGQSNASPLDKIYAHTGVCTTAPIYCQTTIVPFNSAVWEHVVGNWGDAPADDNIGAMTNEGNGVWRLRINDFTRYYGADSAIVNLGTSAGGTVTSTPMPEGATAYTMGLVFRSADATQSGRDNFCQDIFITNLQTADPVVIQSGDPDLNPWPNSPVTFRKVLDGVELSAGNEEAFYYHKKVYPNPFNDNTRIEFFAKENSDVFNVNVYDVNGKQLINLFNARPSLGLNTIDWNGTDAAGNKLPQGIYYFTIASAKGTATDKLIITE